MDRLAVSLLQHISFRIWLLASEFKILLYFGIVIIVAHTQQDFAEDNTSFTSSCAQVKLPSLEYALLCNIFVIHHALLTEMGTDTVQKWVSDYRTQGTLNTINKLSQIRNTPYITL